MIAKYHKLALTASIALAMALIFSCSTDDTNDGGNSSNSGGGTSSPSGGNSSSGGNSGSTSGSFIDNRDSKSYKWVKIGTQIWMAENLNYKTEDGKSRCYPTSGTTNTNDADNANCNNYGRLYTWAVAMNGAESSNENPSGVQGACPVGWHLPSDVEWDVLMTTVGGQRTAGTKLKADSDLWNRNGKGTDEFGFSALPGGSSIIGEFSNIGTEGCWWSSYSRGLWATYYRCIMDNSGDVKQNENYASSQYSVRCVHDSPNPPNPGLPSSSSSVSVVVSSSSGAAQGGVGSCTLPSGLCGENIPQAECINGTFSTAACGAAYTYCVAGYPEACELIGNTAVPNKASCPADEDGIKTFANATACGGAKGSCVFSWGDGLYKQCLDVNRGLCENVYSDVAAEDFEVIFQTGECGTEVEQYPCCISDDGVEYFVGSFTKSSCYAKHGMPANAGVCTGI